MFDIRLLANVDIDDKLLYSLNVAVGNDEIINSVIRTRGNAIRALLLSEDKIFYFDTDGKISHTDVFSFDEVKDIVVVERKKEYRILVLLENGQKIEIAGVPLLESKNLKETFDKISSSLNETFLKTTKEDYITSENAHYKKEEPRVQETFTKNNNESKINQKQARIVDDNKVASDTTFSSKYINEILSKRNTFLPNGALNNIDKLWSKVDDLEIDIASYENKLNSKFNEFDSQQEKQNQSIEKLENFANTGIKEIIEHNKNNFEDYIKSEVNFINNKLDAEIIKMGKEDDALEVKIKELGDLIGKKIITIQEEQIAIVDNIKKALEDHKVNSKEIYVTQKAWLEGNKLIKKNEDTLYELETFLKRHVARIDEMFAIKKSNDERIVILEDSIHTFLEENMLFNKSISKKIEMLENGGNESSKSNDDKIREINEKYNDLLAINKAIEKEFQNMSNELIELKEQSNQSNKQSKQNNNNVQVQQKVGSGTIETFTAKSYTINGERRFGLRSAQTIRLNTLDNEIGMDALYVSDTTGQYLNIADYDGIFFRNQKYYFSIPNEFEIEKRQLCKINYVEYENGTKVFRNYQLVLNANLIEYRVYNEKGFIFNDAVVGSSKYDLKKLTFFKD